MRETFDEFKLLKVWCIANSLRQDDDKIVLVFSASPSCNLWVWNSIKRNEQTNKSVCLLLVKWNLMIMMNMQFHQFRAFKWFLSLNSLHSRYTHAHTNPLTPHMIYSSSLDRFHLQFTHSMKEAKKKSSLWNMWLVSVFASQSIIGATLFIQAAVGSSKMACVFAVANCNLSIYKYDDWFGVNWFFDGCCDFGGLEWNMTQYHFANTYECEFYFVLICHRLDHFYLKSFTIQTLL